MGIKVPRGNQLIESEHFQTVDHLLKLKKTKPFWEVIEAVIKTWHAKNPKDWDSYILHLEAVKKDQKKKHRLGGSDWRGVSNTDGIERSLVVDLPVWIDMCIRVLYKGDDIQFDKKFYRTFARKFPVFRIREKV